MAQSPPPPQLSLEYNFQNRQQQRTGEMQTDEFIASPHSLPNFKMLDNQLQQHQFLNKNEARVSGHSNTNACSLVATAPDDFVFIESVS